MTIEARGLFYVDTPLPAWGRMVGGSGFDDYVNGFDKPSQNYHMNDGDMVYVLAIKPLEGIEKDRGMTHVTFFSSDGVLRRVKWWAQNQNALGCVERVELRSE